MSPSQASPTGPSGPSMQQQQAVNSNSMHHPQLGIPAQQLGVSDSSNQAGVATGSVPHQQQPAQTANLQPKPPSDPTAKSSLDDGLIPNPGPGEGVVAAGSAADPAPPPVPLLPWEQQIMNEVMEQDALIITAAGLGWQRLVAVLLRLQHYQQRGCVLLLGLYPWQRQVITQELARHDPQVPAPLDVNNEVPAMERMEMYRSRAALCVTSRILVVDLLTARITPTQIAGILILNAHRVTDTGGEAFAVRLFRSGGSSARGWVRAFSDTPTAFAGGFNKVEKVMRALQVRHVGLWPRFRHEVSVVMEAHTPQVVEWQQELPHTMLMIQAAVMEVTDALLKELKRSHKVDIAGLSAEQLSARNLSEVVRRQLEPVWDTLGWRTRQLVKDVRTLRDISHHLTTCDAVTFLAYLESLRLSAGPRTVWLFHDAANTIYEQARRRVYLYCLPGSKASTSPSKERTSSGTGNSGGAGGRGGGRKRKTDLAASAGGDAPAAASGSSSQGGVEPVLEEIPKWELLHKVLAEVQERRQALLTAQPGMPHPFPQALAGPQLSDGCVKAETGPVSADPTAEHTAGPAMHSKLAAQQPGNAGTRKRPGSASTEIIVLSDSDEEVKIVGERRSKSGKTPASTQQPQASSLPSDTHHTVHKAAAIAAETVAGHHGSSAPRAGTTPREGVAVSLPSDSDSSVLTESEAAACVAAGQAPVLIVSRELHSSGQLESVLRVGGTAIMKAAYEAYLLRMEAAKGSRPGRGSGAAGSGRGAAGASWRGRGRGRGRSEGHLPEDFTVASGTVPAQMHPGEASALAAEATRVAHLHNRLDDGSGTDPKRGHTKRAKRDAPQASQPPPPDLSDAGVTAGHTMAAAGTVDGGTGTAGMAAGLGDAAVGKGRGRGRGRGAGGGGGRKQGRGSGVSQHLSIAATHTAAGAAAAVAAEARDDANKSTPHAESADVFAQQQSMSDVPGNGEAGQCLLLQGVHFVSLDSHQAEVQLWQLQPGTVIMYDPDLAFLRQVEVYAAAMPAMLGLQLQVHLLSYADSPEQAAFLAAVEKEVSVFTSLIEFKGHIAIPAAAPPANQLVPGGVGADEWLDVYQQNSLTRAGARTNNKTQPRRLVVDMREFMSSLPAVLHQQGFELVPVTLEVGDYVLSPDMCVERKAIPDLIASLASGRLYSQAEAMVKHYKMPVLLIEFDSNKKFGLQPINDLGDDIDPKAIGSRLVLLTLHFPKLRLVWSRSLHATADIFASLKSNQDEPDVAAAQAVGLPPEAQVLGGVPAGADPGINTSAVELLKRLPGVTDTNARLITSSVQSLAELAALPLFRLEAIMCSQRNARLLHDFLHAPCPKP